MHLDLVETNDECIRWTREQLWTWSIEYRSVDVASCYDYIPTGDCSTIRRSNPPTATDLCNTSWDSDAAIYDRGTPSDTMRSERNDDTNPVTVWPSDFTKYARQRTILVLQFLINNKFYACFQQATTHCCYLVICCSAIYDISSAT